MKKIILLLFIILILTGCNKHDEAYYTKYADIAISLFRKDSYDANKIYSKDRKAMDEYLTRLTHKNEVIVLNDYIDKNEPTTSPNSSNITVKNGVCTISYENLSYEFKKNATDDEGAMEPSFSGVCEGYYFNVSESNLYPDYESTKNNPRYDYVLLKSEKSDDKFNFYYRSTYDGSGLKLVLNLKKNNVEKVITEFVNVDYIIQGEK